MRHKKLFKKTDYVIRSKIKTLDLKGMKFRVFAMFLLFLLLIMLLVYIFQIRFIPLFFDYAKNDDVNRAAEYVLSNWAGTPVSDALIEQYAKIHSVMIVVETADSRLVCYDRIIADDEFLKFRFTPEIKQNILDGDIRRETVYDNGKRAVRLLTHINDDVFIMVFSFLEPIDNVVSVMTDQFFAVCGTLLLLSLAISYLLVVRLSKPVTEIANNAPLLASGKFSMVRLKGDYSEIAFLKRTLNSASKEIEKTDALRKDFLANVSHDMKTPLTMIKAYAEMIRDLSGDSPDKRRKHLEVIIGEAERLNALVMDVLELSKLQSGIVSLFCEKFNLSALALDIGGRLKLHAEKWGSSVEFEVEPNVFVYADRRRIEQVIYNLLNNAINYSDGKPVLIVVKKNIADITEKTRTVSDIVTVRLEIHDKGKGIPAKQLPFIWERYKGDSKRHRRGDGTGLGLSIVKGILDIHGFKYGADTEVGVGSCFYVEFTE